MFNQRDAKLGFAHYNQLMLRRWVDENPLSGARVYYKTCGSTAIPTSQQLHKAQPQECMIPHNKCGSTQYRYVNEPRSNVGIGRNWSGVGGL